MLFLRSRSNVKVTARSNQINMTGISLCYHNKSDFSHFLNSRIRCNTVHLFHFVYIHAIFVIKVKFQSHSKVNSITFDRHQPMS